MLCDPRGIPVGGRPAQVLLWDFAHSAGRNANSSSATLRDSVKSEKKVRLRVLEVPDRPYRHHPKRLVNSCPPV